MLENIFFFLFSPQFRPYLDSLYYLLFIVYHVYTGEIRVGLQGEGQNKME